ncbi:DUF3696 domain-containing protein [Vibrio vulnificus]|uniref:DUF3696 domain-containing protein n=1 Tax=Vibrio vulnificus TaxID=672 RepID=UPI000D3E7DD5|nr:DUF3696 domain-containing protein [Vibrio vulnificus]EGR0060734.1 DUF3696 domain-containing protein [Vibrio vulnificus]EIJ0967212.1 DUF3696 domain-containing protein [Vibrio vulnificus]EIJ0971529.1 DUF3696 domain-containing protein [Vibrio vulnificus]EIO3936998.1 DUF3696 domain-containing protein [Vibrio vulnificus]EJE8556174.1 DUF3696 domain-containing protein [Vibrio vulnificus]
MIESIELHNFKCYKHKQFDFSNLTVFCGTNSVGKSTAIQALSIPLQSRFEKVAKLNGLLVSVGFGNDIHHKDNTGQIGQDLSLSIKITLDGYTLDWGYKELEHSSNELQLLGEDSGILLKKFNDLISSFQYLQAERLGPQSSYDLIEGSRFHGHWLGAKGEFTSEVLSRSQKYKPLYLGGAFAPTKNNPDPRMHESESSDRLLRQINAWLNEISPGIELNADLIEDAVVSVNIFGQNYRSKLKPQNVGFGVSYVLGIVTALLNTPKDGLVIIENPEAHLHPRGQSYLGRLIALTAQAGVQVIVETHSDHLLNGIRVITRLKEDFDPKLFTLYYISQGEIQSNVEKITITKDGKLSNWPIGFFDQQAQDMFMIMTGKTQLPTKGA